MSETFYVGLNGSLRLKSLPLMLDEERIAAIDFNAYVGAKSTTLSSVTWTSESDSTVSVSGAAISSGTATAELSADAIGAAIIKVAATLANGEVLVRKFYCNVTDPRTGGATDYLA